MTIFLYILTMAGVTYIIRMLPMTMFQKKIKSRFLKSVLYYIPYTVLSAMTFPTVFYSTGDIVSAAVGTAVALVLAFLKLPMTVVALSASGAALLVKII